MLRLALLFALTLASQDGADQLFQSRQFARAAEAYAARVEANAEDAEAWYRLGYCLHALGRFEEATTAHERAASFGGPNQPTAAYNAACAHALQGQVEPALDWLERAVGFGFGAAAQLELDGDLASLHGEARFDRLRRQLLVSDTLRYLRPLPTGSADQFDFWIGEWDTAVWSPDANNGWVPSGRLTMKVERVAGGQALVEWAEGAIGSGPTLGFSLRVYEPALDAWTLLLDWPSPDRPLFYSMRGGFRHGRGEFVSTPNGLPNGPVSQTKFSFSDADGQHLRWDGSVTKDSGLTWNTNLLFEFTRRAADAAPLVNGPSRSNSHATLPELRQLDDLVGSWHGERTGAEPGELDVEIDSVLEGSALSIVSKLTGEGGATREAFSIAAFEPARKAWVLYRVVEGRPRIERFEGTRTEDRIQFVGKAGPGSLGSSASMSWALVGETLELELTGPDGTRIWHASLTRRV